MPAYERTDRYSTVAIWFHWTIALLVIVNLAVGLLDDPIPALRSWMGGHKAIGITILVLTLGRIMWRITNPAPPLPADVPVAEKGLAHATHFAFYALLLAMPLTGWMMVSGSDKRSPLNWFGLFDIPYLQVSKAAGGFGHSAHGVLGWLMLALVVLHVAAALRHHLILRNTVLARMAPGLRR